jgi:GxxExxY protein
LRSDDLTGRIIGACFDVANELGQGFVESVYNNALIVALNQRGIKAQRQVPLKVYYQGVIVGEFIADVLAAEQIIVELKCVSCLLPEHQAQLINYLNATGLELGLLVSFGPVRIEHKRCHRSRARRIESKE